MTTYGFRLWDDHELYHWQADSLAQALEEICADWEIEATDIEYITAEDAEQ